MKETYEMVHACFLHYRAIVMFNALMEDGLTKEAMKVREYILSNGEIPPVVLYTDHIVACTKAGKREKVMEVYKRMRANGITPNAYTYSVLIQALAKDPNFLGDAKKYLLKMLHKGLQPNFETYSAVVAAFAQAEKFEECLEILKRMQAKGFDLAEEIVKGGKMCEEALKRKRT